MTDKRVVSICFLISLSPSQLWYHFVKTGVYHYSQLPSLNTFEYKHQDLASNSRKWGGLSQIVWTKMPPKSTHWEMISWVTNINLSLASCVLPVEQIHLVMKSMGLWVPSWTVSDPYYFAGLLTFDRLEYRVLWVTSPR